MTFRKTRTVSDSPRAAESRSAFTFGRLRGLATLACCGLFVACGNQSEPAPTPPASQTNAAPAASQPRPEFAKLLGKWERPDGGYILEIKDVEASGKLAVGYFNPSAVNVSRAIALQDGTTTKVFVELQDANYPGCTYTLVYERRTDQLVGQYYQAALRETFEVGFTRLK